MLLHVGGINLVTTGKEEACEVLRVGGSSTVKGMLWADEAGVWRWREHKGGPLSTKKYSSGFINQGSVLNYHVLEVRDT